MTKIVDPADISKQIDELCKLKAKIPDKVHSFTMIAYVSKMDV